MTAATALATTPAPRLRELPGIDPRWREELPHLSADQVLAAHSQIRRYVPWWQPQAAELEGVVRSAPRGLPGRPRRDRGATAAGTATPAAVSRRWERHCYGAARSSAIKEIAAAAQSGTATSIAQLADRARAGETTVRRQIAALLKAGVLLVGKHGISADGQLLADTYRLQWTATVVRSEQRQLQARAFAWAVSQGLPEWEAAHGVAEGRSKAYGPLQTHVIAAQQASRRRRRHAERLDGGRTEDFSTPHRESTDKTVAEGVAEVVHSPHDTLDEIAEVCAAIHRRLTESENSGGLNNGEKHPVPGCLSTRRFQGEPANADDLNRDAATTGAELATATTGPTPRVHKSPSRGVGNAGVDLLSATSRAQLTWWAGNADRRAVPLVCLRTAVAVAREAGADPNHVAQRWASLIQTALTERRLGAKVAHPVFLALHQLRAELDLPARSYWQESKRRRRPRRAALEDGG